MQGRYWHDLAVSAAASGLLAAARATPGTRLQPKLGWGSWVFESPAACFQAQVSMVGAAAGAWLQPRFWVDCKTR
jgi:hypothetical protein